MGIKEWISKMIELLRRPEPVKQEQQQSSLSDAYELIDKSFTPRRAQTCKSVLDGMLKLASDVGSVTGMSQKEIGRRIGWSASTVGYYTRRMDELHLLSTTRNTVERYRNGRFRPNIYIFADSVWKKEEFKIESPTGTAEAPTYAYEV